MQRIFVSAAFDKHLTPAQQRFKAGLLGMVTAAGFDPQLIGVRGLALKTSWSFDTAEDIVSRSHGAIVMGFARHQLASPKGRPVKLTTEYNHYEGALVISHKLPVLILAEDGVSRRGVIDRGGGRFIVDVPAGAKPAWLKTKAFKPYFDAWVKSVRGRKDIFFGYCSGAQATADAIVKYLQNVLKVSVQDWALGFDPGPSILQEIAKAAEGCHSGIFLLTKDDASPGSKKGKKAAPRDNVIFEAGYFMHAKGPSRVLIVLERGAKLPADLGGSIYADLVTRTDISSTHEPLRKFCSAALDLDQA